MPVNTTPTNGIDSMSGSTHLQEASIGDGEDPSPAPGEEINVLGIVLTMLLVGYAVVGVLALLLSAYGAVQGWTLYGGRPYWASISWPVGAVGLLVPGLMELDEVTEVRRTPPVLRKAVVGYGLAAAGYLVGSLFSSYPAGVAGLVATVAFTVLSLRYVRER